MKACRTSDFWWIYSVLKEWQGDMDFLFENAMQINVDKTCAGVARFWGWVGGGLCRRKLKIVLHWTQSVPDSSPPIIGQEDPTTEFGVASAKMFLWKNGNSWKRRREHGDNEGTEIGGGNLRETAREYWGQRGWSCSTADHISPKAQSLWKAHAKAEEKSKAGASKATTISWLTNTATPSSLDPLPHGKYWMQPLAITSWEVRGAWCVLGKKWYIFLKCCNDFFSWFAFVSQYLKE